MNDTELGGGKWARRKTHHTEMGQKKCTRFNKDKVLQLEQTHVTVKTVDRLCGKQLCGRGSGGAGAQQAEQEPAGDCTPAATKADTSWTASARVLPADQGM